MSLQADERPAPNPTSYWDIPELAAAIRPGAFTQGVMSVPRETVPSGDSILWRFLDFPKLVSVLETRALFFTRADKLEDPFEGAWSDATLQLLRGTVEREVVEYDDYVLLRNRSTGQSLQLRRPITVPMSPEQRQVFDRVAFGCESDSTHLSASGGLLVLHHLPTGQRFILQRGDAAMGSGDTAIAYALGDRDEAIKVARQMVDGARTRSRFTMVNCWYEGDHESDAMWKLYSNTPYGLAIRTDMRALVGSFVGRYPNAIARVQYIPYTDEVMPLGIDTPFLFKRINFEHEREVRVIMTQYVTYQHLGGDRNRVEIDFSTNVCEVGLHYNVEPERLIQEIVVSPYAAPWLLELTRAVVGRYNLGAPVRESKLREQPTR